MVTPGRLARRSDRRPADAPGTPVAQQIEIPPRNVWQAGWVVLALVAIALFARFVLDDGGATIFTVLMAWFAALAVEPAVAPLARRMKRGFAAVIVLVSIVVLSVLFVLAFGQLLLDQIARLIAALPELAATLSENLAAWAPSWAHLGELSSSLQQPAETVAASAGSVLGSVLGAAIGVVSSVFGLFTFGLFFFYFCADGPRLREWLLALTPPRVRPVFATVYDTTAEKTGHYVAARVVLATINSVTSGIVFWAIGMPYWLALAIWTGVVAQFVPTIGTYISIILPVLVGLLSGDPWVGVAALVWALIYQQVENLTIEPKISARAVAVHPAVTFGSVMLGAALFGVAGALLAIPVAAMALSLLSSYRLRYAS